MHTIFAAKVFRIICHTLAGVLFAFTATAQAAQSDTPLSSSSAWNLFEPAQDIQLGEELDEWLMASMKPVDSTRLKSFVEAMRERLGSNSLAFPPSITLLADPQPHAFEFPGGRVYLTTGMLAAIENETTLAALLAHEIAHSELRHATQALSRAKRFAVPAALAAASTGRVDMLESMVGIELDPRPGAPWSDYRSVDEAEAIEFSARLLAHAGYDPTAAADFLQTLKADNTPGALSAAQRFGADHPVAEGDAPNEFAEIPWNGQRNIATERAFRNLRSDAKDASPETSAIDAVFAWAPPPEPEPGPEPRELFIAASYVFSYPSEWIPSKAGPNETIEVAPKGEREKAVTPAAGIRVGVIAGTIPWNSNPDDARRLVLEHVNSIRPGLQAVLPPENLPPPSDIMQSLFLGGEDATGSEQLVWLVTRGLNERLFYLLMVAPEESFPEYRPEFERIFQSIDFLGHPLNGPAGAKGHRGLK